MPHIIIKMLKGRTLEQKKLAAQIVGNALEQALGCDKSHISVALEDFTPEEWQKVYQSDIAAKQVDLLVQPNYDPKSLLKKI